MSQVKSVKPHKAVEHPSVNEATRYRSAMDEKWDQQDMKRELQRLQERERELEEKCQSLTDKLSAVSGPLHVEKIQHSADFWTNIENGILKSSGPYGSNAIKQMVKTGKMTVHDTDVYGHTLLIMASRYGAYELAQFLINNVCDS